MLLWWLIACEEPALPEPTPEEVAAAWAEPGPWTPGYRESSLTYDAVDAPGRVLRLALWYPSEATTGPEASYRGLFAAPGVLDGVPVAEGGFPLVVFSHGHQGFAENSGALCARLASHGWVVAAPDHTGNTTFDGPDRDTPIYLHRVTDLSATLDHVTEVDPLAAHIDGPFAGFGHSFGGYTLHAAGGASYDPARIAGCLDGSGTGAFCTSMDADWAARFEAGVLESRLQALISMAPGDFGLFGSGLADIQVPTLQMAGSLDRSVGDASDIWGAMDHPGDVRVLLPRASHNSFTDFAGVVSPEENEIDASTAHRVLGVYALAFLDARLRGGEAGEAVLSGAIPVEPDEVEVSTH
jgi:predicted dienelactone hydrolase